MTSRSWYGVAVLVLFAGIGAAVWTMLSGLSGLDSALTRIVVPGSRVLTLNEAGAYTIYHEYESVIDGLRERVARYSGKSLADMTAVQIKIAEAGACIDTARRVMRHHCQTAQTLAEQGDVPDLLLKATWRRDGAFSAGLCERAVDVLFKLGGGGALFDDHPLQRAFVAEQAAQCGMCMNGMIMGAKALLDKNPNPSTAQIKDALDGNLCRCSSHLRVIRAIQRAARERV